MIFLSPWWLLGLTAIVPLALANLRGRPRITVASTVLWRELAEPVRASRPRLRRPAAPLPLMLQALAVALLTMALARPATAATAHRAAPGEVIVLDAGPRMAATDLTPDRWAAARSLAERKIAHARPGSRIAVVAATASPFVAADGTAATAQRAVARLHPTAAPPDMVTALALAARLGHGPVTVITARGDPLPTADRGAAAVTVGDSSANQGLSRASIRCKAPGRDCVAFARARNDGTSPVRDRLEVTAADGEMLTSRPLNLPERSAVAVTAAIPAWVRAVRLRLTTPDILAADNTATLVVPGRRPTTVLVAGPPAAAASWQRAFAAVPGVRASVTPPARYRAGAAARSDLTVLAGWLPRGGVPASPAVLLAGPPAVPGGSVHGHLRDTAVSGTAPASALLAGADLTSLSVPPAATRLIRPPGWVAPVVWSPSGPLLAAGQDSSQRLAVLAFDPAATNMPSLPAFPVLAANLAAWAAAAIPPQATAGESVLIPAPPATGTRVSGPGLSRGATVTGGVFTPPAPGLYTVTERGRWGLRRTLMAVNTAVTAPPALASRQQVAPPPAASPPGAGPSGTGSVAAARGGVPRPWWPWTGLAALAALLAEGLCAWRQGARPRTARQRTAHPPAAHPSTAHPSAAHPPAAHQHPPGRAGWRAAGRRSPALLRAAAAAAGVLALVLPGVPGTGGGAPVMLVDRAGAVTPPQRAQQDAWLRALSRSAPRVPVITFGQRDPGASIGAALRAGLAASGDASRIVLLSSGQAADGTEADAAAQARARGVPVDVVPAGPAGADAAVTSLRAPATTYAGGTVPLQVTVRSTATRTAGLSVLADGGLVKRMQLRLRAGDNPLLLSLPAGRPGWRYYWVTVSMRGDEIRQNDSLDAVTRVAPRPRLRYVDGGGGGRFTALARSRGFAVRVTAAGALPASARGYAGTDVVALGGISGRALSTRQAAALAAAVRTRGLGLLVLGGPDSLSAAWYASTPLAGALPVAGTGTSPGGGAAVELVLDRSGSMNDLAGDASKIDMARVAAGTAVRYARRHGDDLGIVSFDAVPHVLVPMQRMSAGGAARAGRAVRGLSADGGTDIYRALRAGLGQVTRATTTARHIILMTDGVSQSSRYAALLARLRSAGVTVSTVGLGGDVDASLLRHLAAAGGGRYYYTRDARDLPRIFATEARRSQQPADITGTSPAALAASVPAVRSLIGAQLPAVGGYDATELRPGASADIVTPAPGGRPAGPRGNTPRSTSPRSTGPSPAGPSPAGRGGTDPLLAQWQYGTGRVAVWAPGASAGWAGAWTGAWPRSREFWDDTLRWLLPGVPVPPLQAGLAPPAAGRAPLAEIDTLGNAGVALAGPGLAGGVIDPSGHRTPAWFAQTAPGEFSAPVPGHGPGIYRITAGVPGERGTATASAVAAPYPAEFLPGPGGRALLAGLAAVTGGRVAPSPGWEVAHNGRHVTALWWPLLLLALATYLAALYLAALTAGLVRGALPRRRPPPAGGGSPQAEDDEAAAHGSQLVDR